MILPSHHPITPKFHQVTAEPVYLRDEMKKSRFKIWLRAFLFVQFSAFILVDFLLNLIIPMKADMELGAVTAWIG
jgi:hypothetical protein